MPLELSQNTWLVLNAVRARGKTSRKQLSEDTNLSWSTISKLVEELKRKRFLLEKESARVGRAGPESEILSINGEAGYFIGIDVGSTSIKVQMLDLTLRSADLGIEPVDTGKNIASIIRNLWSVVDSTLAKTQDKQVLGLGFDWPGAVDNVNRTVHFATNLPLGAGLTLSHMLPPELMEAMQDKIIVVDHDTQCVATAEKMIGGLNRKPRPENHIVCVTLGTGVGAGLIVDGRVYRGTSNYCGELGHFIVNEASDVTCGCGKRGCLEQEISGPALMRKWQARNRKSGTMAASEVALLAREGDLEAQELFNEMGTWLGKGVSYIVNMLNPDLIVLNGGVAEAYDLFLPTLLEAVQKYSWKYVADKIRIEKSRLGPDAAACGAAISVLRVLSHKSLSPPAPALSQIS